MGRLAYARRPFLRYNGQMQDAAELLKRADTALALPRLGGMARPNGVVIVSERYWAFAAVDGTIREGRMPQPPRPPPGGRAPGPARGAPPPAARTRARASLGVARAGLPPLGRRPAPRALADP